ncbi:MAG: carbohydrate ABC transporter substrate-binding protein [Oscillospiraceae bacterium]|nr:carbohydrate ABC transporter substrate-binding protein [Oscillospiraceae bacterium]
MKMTGKILSVLLTGAVVLSMTACNNEGGGIFSAVEAPDIDPDAATGVVTYFTYETNFMTDNAEMLTLFRERYNGSIDVQTGATSLNYFEMLGTKIATGDSPDLIRYEWMAFPHGMSYNMFTPLDKYIDFDDPLWSGMKETAEQYAYNGKHFYVPYMHSTYFALLYNNVVLKDNGINDDPIEYVKNNTWDWPTFEGMLKRWMDINPNNVGYNGVSALPFAFTTGKKMIEITPDGQILNNLMDTDVVRCMDWLEGMRKNGLTGATAEKAAEGKYNGYTDPQEAFKPFSMDGGLLMFLGMEPTWAYGAAKQALDAAGIENEIKFIPFPRDPQADKWYQATDTYGYLIPAGAKNVKGAMDWITLLRTEEIDPENIANAKAKACDSTAQAQPQCLNRKCNDTINPDALKRHVYTDEENAAGVMVCPSCNTPREMIYKVVWTEEQWDMYQEMLVDGEKYTLLYDNLYGFSTDFKNLFVDDNRNLLTSVLFGDNEKSYTQRANEIMGSVEGYLQPYRDRMAADARGEEVTTTPAA